ncbi:MAG: hypothetical protein CSA33_04935 [Desulfobulbus propionicus]|nr:MAG: hypothetical protein CSA33_04935 [Desulfobulbus propionicus]
MAIFRCNKCGHIREVESDYIGKLVLCPICDASAKIYDTIPFINALIKTYVENKKELNDLRSQLTQDAPVEETSSNFLIEDVDIYNTNILTQSFTPITEWFKKNNIEVEINPYAVDTTGFFDEVALLLGNDFDLLSIVSNQIKYIQNKGYENVKIDLSKRKAKEIQKITSFCKYLYDYSFVAKYHYRKKDKIIWLTLQKAPKVRDFFNGIWMEWFSLMKLLEFFREEKINVSCSRNIKISFSKKHSNELDLFFLLENGIPICIECKTGEFRHEIDKYLSLRKELNINKNQFVICVFGLSQEQVQGLTSMYDLTFVNEHTLVNHVKSFI